VRILVTGASGFVGARLAADLAPRHDVLGTWLTHAPDHLTPEGGNPPVRMARVDLRDQEAVEALLRSFRPHAVAHLASRSRLEDGLRDPRTTWAVNAQGTAHLVAACRGAGARLLLLSTDSVFDGRDGPYAENASADPIHDYGRSKLAAEEAVRKSGAEHLVVRVSLVYGWSRPWQHTNFAETAVSRLRRGEPVVAYADMIRSPVYAGDLAAALGHLLERGARGLAHVGPPRAMSMAAFAGALARAFDLDEGLVATPDSPPDLDPFRPRALGLRVEATARSFGLRVSTVQEGLARMRREEASGMRPGDGRGPRADREPDAEPA
jgi:dTDP-4-dehydrorhamnose reductase